MGHPSVLFGKFTPKKVRLSLYYDSSINWIVNGLSVGTSGQKEVDYGSTVTVTVSVNDGYTGTPIIIKDNHLYVSGTKFVTKEDSVFKVTGIKVYDASTSDAQISLVDILLVALLMMLCTIAIVIIRRHR